MKHLDFEINDLESRFLCQKEAFETLYGEANLKCCIYSQIEASIMLGDQVLMGNFVPPFIC
jgi:hypothetical protein